MYHQVKTSVLVALVTVGTLLVGVLASNSAVVNAQGEATPEPTRVWFHEDFSTRANRWRLLDLGKAVVSYDDSALSLEAQPADYALWSVPDTDLKLDRYDIQVVANLVSGNDDARAGVIIGYRNENDMLVLAVSRRGNVYLGRYYFGVWSDVIPPTKVKLDPTQPVTLRAIIDADHALRLVVNDQPAGKTVIKNFKASSFGLFALSGKAGGVHVTFSRFVVSDLQ
jgi:hypothetical protein